ncbi:unnamed protein product [Moneuplotes crassus]|uniref:Cytochrome P450 n=1 Tax=Euplotes crassus TaxID=5936 RepID=A0A7S3KFT6_EUPCR|nr:unnamed protein product [Moneuplotes crassus]|mmetsp:Transcript_25412/g.25158  ORF Transcript_25412/g.25158 Transcript_25412/m.25158 type:complete len:540 (+) Transcript_25412:25-1644(+)|eukprot:CAMPEP_0197005464 /NCGR_PEP_ID=MMETSP1380-20130617/29479_1 /TAXON_ID=5936 /ORGANISM="Euplotes crassus, Strain CT5" /LENGTH=539 /DNA_ID=CAMNT_0042424617 /DNA_START=24 /DNA_END=1643 /DNA_ORIENTATION=-
MQEIIILLLIAFVLYFVFNKKDNGNDAQNNQRGAGNAGTKVVDDGADDVEFYEKQNVLFVADKESYSKTFHDEINKDLPHFNTLRKYAASGAKGRDYFGIKVGEETWLFPVSQQDLKELYASINLRGVMESTPFNQAVGYAPRGVPFIPTSTHSKNIRKALTPIFHSDWMEAYFGYFNRAIKDLVKTWNDNSGSTRNVKKDICDMAYDSAVYSLTGAKLDVDVPYHGENGEETIHIRDCNARTLLDFSKHSATDDFCKDKEYRLNSTEKLCENLNKNMQTLGGALTGVVEARVEEITKGAERKKTIVDAAIGLVLDGVLKDVNEGVQNGWAVLNGAHLNCGNALTAALYYLLKNPECLEKLRDEIKTELFEGKDISVDEIEGIATHEKLHDLDYMSHVVKEALRLSSPIYGKGMRARKDLTFKSGFTVRKGTLVYPNNGVIGVSENVWKDPLDFIPERFDPESPYFKLPDGEKREPITWLAFGSGPRACSGDNYSMYFMKIGLVYFLTQFKFELKDVSHEDGFFYWINEKSFDATVEKL